MRIVSIADVVSQRARLEDHRAAADRVLGVYIAGSFVLRVTGTGREASVRPGLLRASATVDHGADDDQRFDEIHHHSDRRRNRAVGSPDCRRCHNEDPKEHPEAPAAAEGRSHLGGAHDVSASVACDPCLPTHPRCISTARDICLSQSLGSSQGSAQVGARAGVTRLLTGCCRIDHPSAAVGHNSACHMLRSTARSDSQTDGCERAAACTPRGRAIGTV